MTILNKKEAESYLHEKYKEGLYKEEKIFTNDIIEKIYLTSAGDKEAIDILCKQYLHDPATKKEERPSHFLSIFFQLIGKAFWKSYRFGPFVVFGSLIIVFAVLLNFFPSFSEYIRQIVHEPKKEEMKLYKKYNIDLPENKKTKAKGDKPPHLLSYDELVKEFPPLQEPTVIEPLSQQPENEIIAPIVANTDNYAKFNETQDLSVVVESQMQPEKDDSSIRLLKKSNIVIDDRNNIESNERTQSLKKDINWLVSQHSEKYVLQLVSAIKEETIANYLAFFGDRNESIIEFTASIDGQKHYILLYGPFDNRDLAYAQIEKLPQKARQIKPWVRTIKSIKNLVE